MLAKVPFETTAVPLLLSTTSKLVSMPNASVVRFNSKCRLPGTNKPQEDESSGITQVDVGKVLSVWDVVGLQGFVGE